jgi:prepilin-type N-terminal cleavage/methylation domain-containing protein
MRDSSNAGYSLLELLVALALTAIIATIMATTARYFHPLRRIATQHELQFVADRIVDVIAQDLEAAVDLPLLDRRDVRSMIGNAHEIRFVAVVKTGFRTESLREVRYFLEAMPPRGQRLARQIAQRRLGGSNLVQTDYLFDPITELEFQYLSRDSQGKSIWVGNWDQPGKAPIAVKISISFAIQGDTISATRTEFVAQL